MRFAEAILRWRKYVFLLNERFHSREDQFFEDPIKVRQQRNRPKVVCVSVIFSFKIGIIFAIVSQVRNESGKRFWIVGVRHMAKHLTGKCVTCKKLRKKPLEQLMDQNPQQRVAAGFPAFSNTAIDMFAPLQV